MAKASMSVAGIAVLLMAGPVSADAIRAKCVFVNPTFSGQCVETVGVPEGSTAQQACETVLGCLNDVRCTMTYCSATEIRGGWTLESATEIEPGDAER